MQKIKTYHELNESLYFNKFGKAYKKITDELDLKPFFIATYGMSITAIFPFFQKLVKNSEFEDTITSTDTVLLTLCGLSIILKESKSDIDKLQTMIKERKVEQYLNIFITGINNLGKLFGAITNDVGKDVKDMFSHPALFVPFLIAFLDVVDLYDLDFKHFESILKSSSSVLISAGIGELTITLKHIANMILKRIKRSNKNKKTPQTSVHSVVQQFESVDTIYNNYFRL